MTIDSTKNPRCLISVIVPVYNVERYLERCVRSLLEQTYKDLEIILVDDGSIDSSSELCDQFAVNEECIQVVHKVNGGLSSARNAGIAKATGDYITFIDSDDWLAPDTYEYCLKLLKKENADVVQFNYIKVNQPCSIVQPKERIRVYRNKEILQYYMESTTKTGSYSVCRCLFPAEKIKNLRFREGKINEDIDYKYKALQQCSVLVTTNQYKYFYFQSGESLSTGGLKKKDLDLYEAAEMLVALTENEQYGTIKKLGKVKAARTSFSLLSKIAYYGIQDSTLNNDEFISKLVREHKTNLWTLISSPIPISRKALSIMFAVSFKMSKTIISILKKWGI